MPKVSSKKQKEPSNEPLKKKTKVSYCCTKKRDLFKKNFIPGIKTKRLSK
jgi:hypothetical protein